MIYCFIFLIIFFLVITIVILQVYLLQKKLHKFMEIYMENKFLLKLDNCLLIIVQALLIADIVLVLILTRVV